MYHSVSEAGGATSIPPQIFSAQMQALEESGLPVIGLDQVSDAYLSGADLPARAAVLTFDDGFRDFAGAAWPEIKRRGWPVTVFLPTDRIGDVENWAGHLTPKRPLMSWECIGDLAAAGVDFGGHTATHPDMTRLSDADLAAEVAAPLQVIRERTGLTPRHFAPPYGRTDPRVRAAIRAGYATACGTELGQAGPGSDPLNLPRLEMFYFTNLRHWRRHLAGRGQGYLALRRRLRRIRQIFAPPPQSF